MLVVLLIILLIALVIIGLFIGLRFYKRHLARKVVKLQANYKGKAKDHSVLVEKYKDKDWTGKEAGMMVRSKLMVTSLKMRVKVINALSLAVSISFLQFCAIASLFVAIGVVLSAGSMAATFAVSTVLSEGKITFADNGKTSTGGGVGIQCAGGELKEIKLTKNVKNNVNMVMAYLTTTPFKHNGNKPLSVEQAAAITSGLLEETSYINPGKIQDNAYPSTISNEKALEVAKGHTSGNRMAMGMFQHREGRAVKMINTAIKNGKHWTDGGSQLEHFKAEMDSDLRGLVGKGFYKAQSQGVAKYAQIFNRAYFGSCRMLLDETISCAEYYPGVDWRERGNAQIKRAEAHVKQFKESGLCK